MSTDAHINSLIGDDYEEVKDTQPAEEVLTESTETKAEEVKTEDAKPAKPPKDCVPHA